MTLNEETHLFGLVEGGCPLHGDEYMRECSACGMEFCATCHPGHICPDCAAEKAESLDDDDLEEAPDFEDISNLKDVLGEDEEAEKAVEEDGAIPPEDLVDDEEDERPA